MHTCKFYGGSVRRRGERKGADNNMIMEPRRLPENNGPCRTHYSKTRARSEGSSWVQKLKPTTFRSSRPVWGYFSSKSHLSSACGSWNLEGATSTRFKHVGFRTVSRIFMKLFNYVETVIAMFIEVHRQVSLLADRIFLLTYRNFCAEISMPCMYYLVYAKNEICSKRERFAILSNLRMTIIEIRKKTP